jgi:hypothetical protein
MLGNPQKGIYNTLDEEWCSRQLKAHQGWLDLIDQDPSELEAMCEGYQLLGKRFEAMIGFWLKNSPVFQVVLSNHQLIDDKGTVGEIDFIVKDRESGELLHLEIACKFYLSHHNNPNWPDWRGLNGRDNLQLKMDKFSRQLSSLGIPVGHELRKELKIGGIQPTMLLKGYFFHHIDHIRQHHAPKFSNPTYPSGFWLFRSEMNSFFSGDHLWQVLPKRSWLCPYHMPVDGSQALNELDIQDKIAQLLDEYKRGVMVVKLIRKNDVYEEVSRGCVVPNHWPNPA